MIGIGVGFAGTPASHSLTGSVPVRRAGMASGTADLQRDLGGAIMQSIFGALLTAGYASAFTAADRRLAERVAGQRQRRRRQLTKSFSSAEQRCASSTRSTRTQIIAGAKTSFIDGQDWAYIAGLVAIVLGAVLVFFMFPKHAREGRSSRSYEAADTAVSASCELPQG